MNALLWKASACSIGSGTADEIASATKLQIRQQQAGQILALGVTEQHGMVRAGAEMRQQAKIAAGVGRGKSHGADEIVSAKNRAGAASNRGRDA